MPRDISHDALVEPGGRAFDHPARLLPPDPQHLARDRPGRKAEGCWRPVRDRADSDPVFHPDHGEIERLAPCQVERIRDVTLGETCRAGMLHADCLERCGQTSDPAEPANAEGGLFRRDREDFRRGKTASAAPVT